MEDESRKKLTEVHAAYKQCKKVFSPSVGIIDVAVDIEDEEEYEFYKMVHEFFFQKKQSDLIEKGVYG